MLAVPLLAALSRTPDPQLRPGSPELGDTGPSGLRWRLFLAASAARLAAEGGPWQRRPGTLGPHAAALPGQEVLTLQQMLEALASERNFEVRYTDLKAYSEQGLWESERLQEGELDERLNDSTVVINHAQFLFPHLASVTEACTEAFALPCNVNVYASPPGLSVSAPPHTDAQDTLILQLQGRKSWRVYAPPDKMVVSGGKSEVLHLQDYELILDTELGPGDSLYVPLGAPHITSTGDGSESSLHLTVGIETVSYKLSFQDLLMCALFAGDVDFSSGDFMNATRTRPELRGSLPLGPFATARSLASDVRVNVQNVLETKAAELTSAFMQGRPGASSSAISSAVNLTLDHYRSALRHSRRMLADAQHNVSRLNAADRRLLYSKSTDALKFGYRQRCMALKDARSEL